MNLLDLFILIFIIVVLAIGIKKGFMRSLLSNFSFGTNCLLSFFLMKPLSNIIDKLFNLSSSIQGSYLTKLNAISSSFSTNLMEIPKESLNSFVSIGIDEGNFGFFQKTMYKIFLNKPNLYETLHSSNHTSRTLADIISQVYSSFYTTIIGFVSSIILIYFAVFIFKRIAENLRKVGSIKVVDDIAGCLYGLFRCFIVFISICLALKLLSPFNFMNNVISYINNSLFGKIIYSTVNKFLDNYLSFSDIISTIFK